MALAVSCFALWDARKVNRSVKSLSEQEIELVRHQLVLARLASIQEQRATVSARMYREGKDYRIRVFNAGPAEARNVKLLLDDSNVLATESAIRGKLPMLRMESGQSVDFWAMVYLSSPSKETLVLRWDDATGIDRENRVEVTV